MSEGFSTENLAYVITIDAGDAANHTWDQDDLARWCLLHGANASDVVRLTVAAYKDGTGHVLLELGQRDDYGNHIVEGGSIKIREVLIPLLEPVPDLVRRIASR